MARYMATLTTGEVVELKKDCDCITHEGPHWIHMDELDKRLNRRLLPKEGERASYMGLMGFVKEEQIRLADKLREMTARRITGYKIKQEEKGKDGTNKIYPVECSKDA